MKPQTIEGMAASSSMRILSVSLSFPRQNSETIDRRAQAQRHGQQHGQPRDGQLPASRARMPNCGGRKSAAIATLVKNSPSFNLPPNSTGAASQEHEEEDGEHEKDRRSSRTAE